MFPAGNIILMEEQPCDKARHICLHNRQDQGNLAMTLPCSSSAVTTITSSDHPHTTDGKCPPETSSMVVLVRLPDADPREKDLEDYYERSAPKGNQEGSGMEGKGRRPKQQCPPGYNLQREASACSSRKSA